MEEGLKDKKYLSSIDECVELLSMNPTVDDLNKATIEFSLLNRIKNCYNLGTIEKAYYKRLYDGYFMEYELLDYDKIDKIDNSFEMRDGDKFVFNYLGDGVDVSKMNKFIDDLHQIISERNYNRESVGCFALSPNYRGDKYLLTFALYEGLNGAGHNVLNDTKNVVSLGEELSKLGYDFRLSDALFDMADDVSAFVVQVFFDKE